MHGHTRHRDIIRLGGRADDSIGHICHPGIPGIGPRDAVVDYLDKSRSDIIDKPFDTAATDFLFPAARPGPGLAARPYHELSSHQGSEQHGSKEDCGRGARIQNKYLVLIYL